MMFSQPQKQPRKMIGSSMGGTKAILFCPSAMPASKLYVQPPVMLSQTLVIPLFVSLEPLATASIRKPIQGPLRRRLISSITVATAASPDSNPPLSADSAALSATEQENQPSHATSSTNTNTGSSIKPGQVPQTKRNKVIATAAMVVIFGVCNRVLYKVATTSMENYIFFLAQLQTFGYILVYFGFLAFRFKSGAATTTMLQIPRLFWPTFIAIGVVEALSSVLSFMGAAKLPGIILPLLSQSIMIWQVLLAYMVGRRLSWAQLLGVAMVVGGVCLAGWPSDPSTSPLRGIDPMYAGIFVFSMLFPALDTILKERVFRAARVPLGRELDLFIVNSFGSLSQAVFVCVLLPLVTSLRGMQLSQLPQYLADGWMCFQGLTPSCGSDCSGAPFLPLIYVTINLAFNIAALNLIRQAGNVVVSLTMSAIVPATIYAFTLPLPFIDAAPPLGGSFFQGAGLLMAGLLMYNVVLWWPVVKRMAVRWVEGKEEHGGGGDAAAGIVGTVGR